MASFYNLEPQPTGKVLFTTTSGDLILELFAKQTPIACRNFLQHCLDGYYNDTVFHRLVSGFIIQGGDPSGTGHGGEAAHPSEGKNTFEDEFHTRLKFNRRGLLGMANGGVKDDNGSQFFLTLAATPELQSKNTMFGRIVGDTIYNLMKMADVEMEPVEGSERPLYPTKITGAEILVNPFEDLVKRTTQARRSEGAGRAKEEKKKSKRKGGKALLSFGNEGDEGGEDVIAPRKDKFNPMLVTNGSEVTKGAGQNNSLGTLNGKSKSSDQKTGKAVMTKVSRSLSPLPAKPNPAAQLPLPNDEEASRSPSESPEPEPVKKMTSLLDKTNAQIADLKASMKRTTATAPSNDAPKKSALERMMPENAVRGKKRKHGGKDDSEMETMNMLNAFRTKLEKAATDAHTSHSISVGQRAGSKMDNDVEAVAQAQDENDEGDTCDLHFIANCQSCRKWDEEGDESEDDNDRGWMSHALSFEKDRLGKDLTWKQKNEEELVVIDPREKAKDIRDGERVKKMARVGGRAGHVTEWGRNRDQGRPPVKGGHGKG